MLQQQGNEEVVISSKSDSQSQIEAIGATAPIRATLVVDFLAETFKGADIDYVVESSGERESIIPDFVMLAVISRVTENYKQALGK